ncbi:MAG: DUF4381 domain-containing protein [Steroidobacteraceae bacterium]
MTPDWISQLAPAHAPPPAGWWPPAPGWWILAALAAAAVAAGLWWWLDPYRRSRRAALRELRAIRAGESNPVASARAIESLLRRFALAVFGGAQVARLTGDAWLAFVAAEGGAPLAGEPGRSLLSTAFGGEASDHRERWIAGADAFVRARRRRRRAPGRGLWPGRAGGPRSMTRPGAR